MRVIKSWYVEWEEPDPDYPDQWQKHSSRRYHVKSSADEFAELARRVPAIRQESINVRTREGSDRIVGWE